LTLIYNSRLIRWEAPPSAVAVAVAAAAAPAFDWLFVVVIYDL
jgi:hypothetical protein